LIEFVKPGTQIDFLGKRRGAAVMSLALILLGLVAIPIRGFRTGIDFAGGTEIQLRFTGTEPVDEGSIRSVLGKLGIEGSSVVRYGAEDAREFLVKLPGELAPSGAAQAQELPEPADSGAGEAEGVPPAPGSGAGDGSGEIGFEKAAEPGGAGKPQEGGADSAPPPLRGEGTSPEARIVFLQQLEGALRSEIGPVEVERVEFVGPKVGAELRRDGLLALSVACLLILVYIGFRFSLRFAPGAVVALVHDVLVTSGIWVILGLEFDLRVLAALLAIIGYSLNDTIIVYDRIRENTELRTTRELESVLNRSVNQTLSRTLLTSLTTLLAVLSLLAVGGPVIRPFALCMAIGIAVGTYSSIFVAAPTLLWLEQRYGKGATA
jgi:preprotein translocase subunit SecF